MCNLCCATGPLAPEPRPVLGTLRPGPVPVQDQRVAQPGEPAEHPATGSPIEGTWATARRTSRGPPTRTPFPVQDGP